MIEICIGVIKVKHRIFERNTVIAIFSYRTLYGILIYIFFLLKNVVARAIQFKQQLPFLFARKSDARLARGVGRGRRKYVFSRTIDPYALNGFYFATVRRGRVINNLAYTEASCSNEISRALSPRCARSNTPRNLR